MNFLKAKALCFCLLLTAVAFSQSERKKLAIKKTNFPIKIDGILNETAWKDAPMADKFVEIRPTPFKMESDNPTQVYFLYNNEGLYVGGYMHEKYKDSVAAELNGRDGFGNNDFIGVVLDTYYDKLNGFEYFVTPLGEQMDAKQSPSGGEDFSWNAVWQSACKMQNDGWSFEMFIPYSAIRFGKKKEQDWGLNIVRRRQKSGQQLFWQPLDPKVNGFLTQEGLLTGIEDIKPPLRLQFSPYLSTYINHDGTAPEGVKKNTATINGGMDVKYGINQAFTLDMTLIPDFGQVQTDNRILNLSPFETKFAENRAFFTEGTELFNKGNLFYSRRIGVEPSFSKDVESSSSDSTIEYPSQAKIINATKISGRTQKGLGIAMLNAITQSQSALVVDKVTGETRLVENMPLTNYNIFVLDQTLKHNSSVSLVNTSVLRSGSDRDANVTSGLFDFNNKKNVWNFGGNISVSNIIEPNKTTTGYAHNLYFNKTSGRLLFNVYQDLYDDKYDKSDLGYFTNNNYMEEGLWVGYRWIKPKHWYNQMQLNYNLWYDRLVKPMDLLKRKEMMYQGGGTNVNGSAQTKKLWWVGFSFNASPKYNDFYEARSPGRVFRNKGSWSTNLWYEGNAAKKYSGTVNLTAGGGGIFHRKTLETTLTGKVRFSSKFSIDQSVYISNVTNQPGFAGFDETLLGDPSIIFSRRDVKTVENIFNLKYSFTNRMGLTLRARHYWSKVDPKQFYELDQYGDLQTPSKPFTQNVNQNYNFLSVDMVYNWQFAQGSFFTVVWKDIGDDFTNRFEKSYAKNFGKTVSGDQFTSLSVKVIYFLDYLTFKNRNKKKA
jgi:hypothetical protein